MVRIERMTMHAIIKGGVREDLLTFLVHDVLKRRHWAARILERAIGDEVRVARHRDSEPCPLEFSDATQAHTGLLYAKIPLGPGTYWEYDTLHGEFPDTLRAAAPGLKLGAILDHPAADPELETTAGKRDGLVSVKRMVVELPMPGLRTRLSYWRYRLSILRQEGTMESATTFTKNLAALSAAGMVAIAIWLFFMLPSGMFDIILAYGFIPLVAWSVWNAIAIRLAQPFSFLRAYEAKFRHQVAFEKI